jgi:hypothetical protein
MTRKPEELRTPSCARPGLSGCGGGIVRHRVGRITKEKKMGLDMYAHVMRGAPSRPVDFTEPEDAMDIHYWRKHPDLHGWMERLYRGKGGESEEFNCVPVALSSGDLDRLEADIKAGGLPHTEGFFFGESGAGRMEGDLAFIAKAREAIEAGLTVYYSSWW